MPGLQGAALHNFKSVVGETEAQFVWTTGPTGVRPVEAATSSFQ